MTPARPVKRRLFATPRSAKRARVGNKFTRGQRSQNKLTARGPSKRGTLTQQVRSLQRVVSSLAPELKYTDITLTVTNLTNSGTVVNLTQIAQGDTISTREGQTIHLKKIFIRGTLAAAADAPIEGFFRYVVFVDKQQVADSSPSVATVIQDGTGSANPIHNLLNVNFLERFRVLWSSKAIPLKRLGLDTDNTTPPTEDPNIEVNLAVNFKVAFNGTASSDIEKNGVFMLFLTSATTDTIDFAGVARLGFTDV